MYLGLDLGTSGLRAILVDAEGTVHAVEEAAYAVSHPHPGWSEQDPGAWIGAAETCIGALRRNAPAASALSAIGVSGQMHGATVLGAGERVLRPAILWNDTRAADQAVELDAAPKVRMLSGNVVFPGFTAPKLLWLRAHEPEVFGAIQKVLLPKDYLRLWLTGEAVSEMSDAAGTSWLDTGARAWSPHLLEVSAMSPDQMPRLVEGSAVSGHLRADLARDWGLRATVPVAGGGGDNAAAACGVGAMAEGQGFVSLGTSGVVLAARDRYAPDPTTAVHTFCHAVPDQWYQMGVMLAATDCLNWLAAATGDSPATLAAALPDRGQGPGAVTFLPYLSGERTPHNAAGARGAFIGLDIVTDRAGLTQAVMEGVAFGLRDCLDALRATGANPERLLAIGGGSRSAFWLSTLATVLDLPLDVPADGEFGAALGAARLAMVADGAEASAVMARPTVARSIEPDPGLTAAYAEAHARFQALYPALRAAAP